MSNQPAEIVTQQDARLLCEQLFNTTNELISLLEQETSLLRKAKTSELATFHVRKDALTATLSHHMNRFKANTELVRELAPDELKNLQNQRSQFQKSIEANHAALTAMQAVSERILQTVSSKVAKKKSGPDVYTAGGQLTRSGAKPAAPINVDTAL